MLLLFTCKNYSAVCIAVYIYIYIYIYILYIPKTASAVRGSHDLAKGQLRREQRAESREPRPETQDKVPSTGRAEKEGA